MIILFIAVCICISGTFWGVTWYLYKRTFGRRYSSEIITENVFYKKDAGILCKAIEIENEKNDKVEILSYDGIKLVGHFYKRKENAPCIIFFHGYHGQASIDGIDIHRITEKMQWNLLLVTHRAHGESGGKYSSIGIKEQYDCLTWAQWADKQFGKLASIYLMGLSLSAVVVLMSSTLKMPSTVCGIIEDSGFTSYSAMASYNARRMMPKFIPACFIVMMLELGAKVFGGFSIYKVDACQALKSDALPVLFIHGSADLWAPVAMAYELYDCCAGEKELLIIEGANHGECYKTDPFKYETKVITFIQRYKKNYGKP